jgi:UDP-N-acetyl-D-glucosamine dehydrogenase
MKNTTETLYKLKNKTAKIGIVGLGYVGLPLVISYTSKGFNVIGFDIDESKIDHIRKGKSYIKHIKDAPIASAVENSLLEVTSDFTKISDVDAIIICVPTPLDDYFQPDLSYVTDTMKLLTPNIRKRQTLSLESTTYPGTTEEVLRPLIEERGFVIGEDFFLIYSPEREDPGNPDFTSTNTPKVVGGSTPLCLEHGVALYESAISKVVPVSSTKVAEFTKLLENIYRSVNIGLVNELKSVAQEMKIDLWEVIDAAATKPFGFKAFYPGPGLGGHCIPIDPFYLTWKAKEFGIHTRFIELSGEINRAMPKYVAQQTAKALNTQKKAINGSKILIMGLAYKENVDDMRESPTFDLLDLLSDQGATVEYYDPHIPVITPTREHEKYTGKKSINWNKEELATYDAVIIATHHKIFNIQEAIDWSKVVIDTRNAAVKSGATKTSNVFKA